uniref:Retrovirus-related Pol polyprotein from transposon TNT 1-94-like beta-barrel domain-containing protein n=1 Tax=Trichuris muris TaxID=70415 RepID=A0A5S6QGC6_TRIMR
MLYLQRVAFGTSPGPVFSAKKLPRGRVQALLLKNVLYVPEIQGNLLSAKRMAEHGFQVTFRSIKCKTRRKSQQKTLQE